MNGGLSEVDKLRMKRRQLEVELNRLTDKVKTIQDEIKAIDNTVACLINSGKEDGTKSFGRIAV